LAETKGTESAKNGDQLGYKKGPKMYRAYYQPESGTK
jgi:hypothetical protein